MPPKPKLASGRPQRSITPAFPKPPSCAGCPLEVRGTGWVPPDGPSTSPILLVGEAAGYDEAAMGHPFMGAAGSMLTRILRMNSYLREDFRVANTIQCAPPGLVLEKTAYGPGAIDHCRPNLDAVLAEGHPVVVPLGGVALRRVLGLGKTKGVRVQEFHGTITRDPTDRFWVVPSYHPSFLQRGATNLLGTVSFDLQVAHEVAKDGVVPDPAVLVGDPPLGWFQTWISVFLAALAQDPERVWLAVDIETPEKVADEAELIAAGGDLPFKIIRINLSCHPDEGITVPADPEYLALLHWLFADVERLGGTILMWNRGFDMPRLRAASMALNPRKVWDLMWLAKVFKSDLPSGLGFWAPFYSKFGAWKHWATTTPVKYAAADGIQTLRVGYGLTADVIDAGLWPVFERHLHDFHTEVLQPASDVGVPINRARLTEFGTKLDAHATRLLYKVQEIVPPDLRPHTPPEGLKIRPLPDAVHTKGRATKKDGTLKKEAPDEIKMVFFQQAQLLEQLVLKEVLVCQRCHKIDVVRTHRCEDGDPENARVVLPQPATVTRWFWEEPFNADSPQQLLAYIKFRGHDPGRNKHTGGDSSDRETLEKLTKTGDPLYQTILDYRAVAKVRGTYVKGTERRLDGEDRLHPTFTFKPSTMRLSCVSPNVQNVITDRGGGESLAAGYRRCIMGRGYTQEATKILELDFAGIEQVIMGWAMNDPAYIRIAKLGTHALVASHVIGRPADLSWSDDDLRKYFKEIKSSKEVLIGVAYDQSKRTVHGSAYGLTTHGMIRQFPKTYRSLKEAEKIQDVYFSVAPSVPRYHESVRRTAYDQHFLGGPPPYCYDPEKKRVTGHPYGYRHDFYAVMAYTRLSEGQRLWREKRKMPTTEINGIWYGVDLGEDGKRVVAYNPQSIARGVLTEAALDLFLPPDHPAHRPDLYIGESFFGRTPLRAPIHDSLLLEVPISQIDYVAERAFAAMTAGVEELPCPADWGIGPYLTIGVDGKIGEDWDKATQSDLSPTSVAADRTYFGAEERDSEGRIVAVEEEITDLETAVA